MGPRARIRRAGRPQATALAFRARAARRDCIHAGCPGAIATTLATTQKQVVVGLSRYLFLAMCERIETRSIPDRSPVGDRLRKGFSVKQDSIVPSSPSGAGHRAVWARALCRLAAFALAGHLAACGGGGGDAAPLAGPAGDIDTDAAVPDALVGTWGFAAATGNYCDPLGQCAAGSGGSESFTFTPQGGAQYALLESALVPGCGEVKTLTQLEGRVTILGSTLVFAPVSGTYAANNACRPDLSGIWSLEPKDLTLMSLDWQFVPDADDPLHSALKITDPAGRASGTYSRRPS